MGRSSFVCAYKLLVTLLCLKTVSANVVWDRLNVGIWTQDGMPLTKDAAVAQNWTPFLFEENVCNPFFGYRYQLNGRLTPTLLYDTTGHLAGIQIVTNISTFPLYPQTNLKQTYVKQLTSELYGMTFYFMDPAKLCTGVGSDHTDGSIGDRLWVRTNATCNGPECFDTFPMDERPGFLDDKAYVYGKGGCAKSGFTGRNQIGMGTHYWGNSTKDYACADSGPLFLLYDRSKLVAFGLTYVGLDLQVPTMGGVRPIGSNAGIGGASLWEFAHQPLYPYFFAKDAMSPCLSNLNTFNKSLSYGNIATGTLHIFMSDPMKMTCKTADATVAAPTADATVAAPTADATVAAPTADATVAAPSSASGYQASFLTGIFCLAMAAAM